MFREEVRNGAGDRIRTGDIDLGKVALYQLSYSREATCSSPEATASLSRAAEGLSNRMQAAHARKAPQD